MQTLCGRGIARIAGHSAALFWNVLIGLFSVRLLSLRLGAQIFSDFFIIISGIKLSPIAAPRGRFYGAVDFPQTFSRNTQGHNLSNSHHHVPTYNFDTRGRKRLIEPLLPELRVDLLKGL